MNNICMTWHFIIFLGWIALGDCRQGVVAPLKIVGGLVLFIVGSYNTGLKDTRLQDFKILKSKKLKYNDYNLVACKNFPFNYRQM